MLRNKIKVEFIMGIPEQLLRIAIGFFALFLLTRLLGRKEISELNFINFVSAIAIGSITADFVLNQNITILHGIIALTGWAAFTFVMSLIDIWSIKGRKIVSGDPVIVIKEGQIVDKELRKQQLDLDALMSLLREKNIFSIADVDFAIFETNGKLSVMPKENKQPVTKMDMNIPGKSKVYPLPTEDRKSTRLNSSHVAISYAV